MYVSVLSASISCSSFLFFLFRFYVFHALILEFIQSPGRHLGFSPTFFMFGLAAATATDLSESIHLSVAGSVRPSL